MLTMEQMVLGALGLTSTGLLTVLLFIIQRGIKSFDDGTKVAARHHEASQRSQNQALMAITRQQEQIKTLFDRSVENRTRIVKIEDQLLDNAFGKRM